MAEGRRIHPTAIIDPAARLGDSVEVGAWTWVGPGVVLGDGVVLGHHVTVEGLTEIGAGTHVGHHSMLGGLPQTTRHKGGPTRTVIGSNCILREAVTVNAGSDMSGGLTSIGDNCFLMTQTHVAHDCELGNNVTMVNGSLLAGHVVIGDHAILGGATGIHQFTRIGRRAFIGGMSGVGHDLIPYGMATGVRANLSGLNLVGLKRSGAKRADIHALRAFYRALFDRAAGTVRQNAERLRAEGGLSAAAEEILDFIATPGKRGLLTPALDRDESADPFAVEME
jgi:UDP-N-acetylglucosamine acyltransferase